MEFRLGSMWDSQCLMLLFWSVSVVYSVGGHLNHDGESSIRHSTGGSSPHADGSALAYSSIELTQIPHWSGNFAVSNATREIYLPAGKTVEDTAPIKLVHEKYFQGAPANYYSKFPKDGIVEYKRLGAIRSLKFRKMEPGMFHFEYEVRVQGKDTSGRWTVYAVPSYRVRRDSFFRQEIELPKFNFEDEVLIKSMIENIGVEVRPDRRSLAVFGLAGLSGNSITLSIQLTSSAPRKVYRLIIRLLVEEHQEPVGEVENIQFWAKDLGTLGSRVKLAECVAKGYGKGLPDLVHAKFEERGKGVTSFTSQLFKVSGCTMHDVISRDVNECAPGIVGWNLTCASGKSHISLPEAFGVTKSVLTALVPAQQESELSNVIDSDSPRGSPSKGTISGSPCTTDLCSADPMVPSTSAISPTESDTSPGGTSQSYGNGAEGTGDHGSEPSLAGHIQFYALVWAAVFIVLFVLIAWSSR